MNLNRKQLLLIRDALAARRVVMTQRPHLQEEHLEIEQRITEQLKGDIRNWELVPEETDGTE